MNEYSEYARIRMNIITYIENILFDKKIFQSIKNTNRFNFRLIKLKLNIGNVFSKIYVALYF
jgi:hypothetical protein